MVNLKDIANAHGIKRLELLLTFHLDKNFKLNKQKDIPNPPRIKFNNISDYCELTLVEIEKGIEDMVIKVPVNDEGVIKFLTGIPTVVMEKREVVVYLDYTEEVAND